MTKAELVHVIEDDLDDHPAVQAWHELQGRDGEPRRVETLKGKYPNEPQRIQRMVCRLVGTGSAQPTVIGKRCNGSQGRIERTIYVEILPHLPLSAPNYYGMVADGHSELCWLFLEDVGEQDSHTDATNHRVLRTQWLGKMHTSATSMAAPATLEDKGPNHYLRQLRRVRDAIRPFADTDSLQDDDLAVLSDIISHCNKLEVHWQQIVAPCAEMPRTLVHGDFVAKNMRVRTGQDGLSLLPFDWGEAGWGVPAVDMIDVDLTVYWSVVRDAWPWLSLQTVQRIARIGAIFRVLDAINWIMYKMEYHWLAGFMSHLRIYRSKLAKTMRQAGLVDA